MTKGTDETIFEDPGLSWSQLRAFEACVRLSSFSGAALALKISAAAVRFQVALLETRLGARLFERHDGRLTLTDIGRDFADQTASPLRALLAACAAAMNTAHDAPLTLTAPPLFARHFLLGEAFLKWCDLHHVRLDVSDTKRDLFGPGPIAAIRLDAEAEPGLTVIPLFQVAVCIAASPSIAISARPNEAAWWAAQTLLCPSASEDGWGPVWRALRIDGACSPRSLSFSSYAAAMAAACAGHGVILAPLPFAAEEFATERLAPVSDVRIKSENGYSLILRDALAGAPRGRAVARRLGRVCGVP